MAVKLGGEFAATPILRSMLVTWISLKESIINSRDEDAQQIDPDGEVGEPSEPLKRSNLAEDHTDQSKDQEAYDEADWMRRAS